MRHVNLRSYQTWEGHMTSYAHALLIVGDQVSIDMVGDFKLHDGGEGWGTRCGL